MSFLKAEWRKLAIANYEIDPKVLEPYLPIQTELDLWEGVCYVSLVGFMFLNTKLKGFSIPFHQNFEEVNLRFYVRHYDRDQWKRGVVFVKEIVPRPALTFVANSIYKEHYVTMKMDHQWEEHDSHREVMYSWSSGDVNSSFKVEAELEAINIEGNSDTEFITEHYWGYTRISPVITYEYEVKHPKWQAYKVLNSYIDVDFKKVYGKDFSVLNELNPKSVMLAEGSEISVENKRKL